MAQNLTVPIGSGVAALSTIPALSNLLLATPQNTIGYQPQTTQGLIQGAAGLTIGSLQNSPALAFHYEGEQTATAASDITDHYAEDNTSLQDQIAIKPTVITTHGFIGDLNDVPSNPIVAAAQLAAQKLTAIAAYAPQASLTAELAYQQAVFTADTALSALNTVASAISSIANGSESVINGNSITVAGNQTPQQIYFQQFYAYQQSRTLFTIQTPWAVFQDMAIMSLRSIQDETTRSITDFEVTFKQMRFATTQTVTVTSTTITQLQGRAANQGAFLVNLGSAVPALSATSLGTAVAGVI